jgi:hypothetical protein
MSNGNAARAERARIRAAKNPKPDHAIEMRPRREPAEAAQERVAIRKFKSELQKFVRAKDQSERHLQTFVRCGADGSVERYERSHSPLDKRPGKDWKRIKGQENIDLLMSNPMRYRVLPNGRVEEKPVVWLSLGGPTFLANGVDKFEVMVVGLPQTINKVDVRITVGDSARIEKWNDREIHHGTSTTPGEWWVFEIVDTRVFVENGGRKVESIDPNPDNRPPPPPPRERPIEEPPV